MKTAHQPALVEGVEILLGMRFKGLAAAGCGHGVVIENIDAAKMSSRRGDIRLHIRNFRHIADIAEHFRACLPALLLRICQAIQAARANGNFRALLGEANGNLLAQPTAGACDNCNFPL